MSTFRAAAVQLNAGTTLDAGIAAASDAVRAAVKDGAQFVTTPENTCFIEMHRAAQLEQAQPWDSHPAVPAFGALAKELGIWLLIGSLTVKLGEERLANRQVLFGDDGAVKATYDKIHMFDVNVPDGQVYRESALFQRGGQAVLAETPWAKLGMSICYDLRFPHLYRALAQGGAEVIVIPAAFTKFTGQAHWQVLQRARAIETGCFVVSAAQTGVHSKGRETYGHSIIVAPWGEVLAEMGEETGHIIAEIDTQRVTDARNMVPAWNQAPDFTLSLPEISRKAGE